MRGAYCPCHLPDRRDDLCGAAGETDCDILHVHFNHSFSDLQKLLNPLKAAPRFAVLTSYSKHTISKYHITKSNVQIYALGAAGAGGVRAEARVESGEFRVESRAAALNCELSERRCVYDKALQ